MEQTATENKEYVNMFSCMVDTDIRSLKEKEETGDGVSNHGLETNTVLKDAFSELDFGSPEQSSSLGTLSGQETYESKNTADENSKDLMEVFSTMVEEDVKNELGTTGYKSFCDAADSAEKNALEVSSVQSEGSQDSENTTTSLNEMIVGLTEHENSFQKSTSTAIEHHTESDVEKINRDANYIKRIPWLQRNVELCYAAVSKDGMLIDEVPYNKRTPRVCKKACENSGEAYFFVPDSSRTWELLEISVATSPSIFSRLSNKEKNFTICRIAVQRNGLLLKYVPDTLKSFSLYDIALQNNGLALEFVPEEWRSLEICRRAVQQNPLAMNYVPEGIRREVCDRMSESKNCITSSGETSLEYLLSDVKAAAWNLKRHILRDRMRFLRRKAFQKAMSRHMMYPYGLGELFRIKSLARNERLVEEKEIRENLRSFMEAEKSRWKFVFVPAYYTVRSHEYRIARKLIAACDSRCFHIQLSVEDAATLHNYWPGRYEKTDGAVAVGTTRTLRTERIENCPEPEFEQV